MNAPTPILDITSTSYSNIEVDYDAEREAIWCWMRDAERPCFTPGLLDELAGFQRLLELNANPVIPGRAMPSSYMVFASRVPGVFSLGGDLDLFSRLIQSQDREALSDYVQHSIKILYLNAINYDLPVTTIALLQGDAIGAGLESALSCDVIVAERGTSMGFPEILFNLFPGMGAHTFLSRRLGIQAVEEMILSGKIYSASEMKEMGVIDLVVEEGEGAQAVNELIDKQKRRRNIYKSLYKARRVVNPISLKELMTIGELWVEAAMQLNERDLRMMQRLLRAQKKRLAAAS